MKKGKMYGNMAALVSLFVMSCGSGMESKIQGKYELDMTPGTTYEFAAQGKFINESKPESMDCTIKATGTWEVKGDSLYITNNREDVSYKFGEGVSEEEQTMIKEIMKGVSEAAPAKVGYKIVSVDEQSLKIEAEGMTLTYTRMK